MATNYINRYLIDRKIYDYRKNFLYIPDAIEIAPEYRCGLTSAEYREAANTLVRFLHHMLDCIQEDPAYYGMACIPVENDDKKNWSKTNTPFYKLTNTIRNIFGCVNENRTQLDCKMSVLKPKLPAKFPHVLEIFQSFDFEITGLDAKMKAEDGENFTVQFPANSHIFKVFHAASTESLWNITNWGIIASCEEDRQRYPLEFYRNHLEDPSLRKLLTEMHMLLTESELSYQTGEKNHILRNALRYKVKKGNLKEFMILRLDGAAWQGITCKIRLAHIRQYQDIFRNCTDTIRNKILQNKQCDHCGNCNTQIVMDNNEKRYIFCNPAFWWMAFSLENLHDLTDADIQSVLSLIRAELPYYLKG